MPDLPQTPLNSAQLLKGFVCPFSLHMGLAFSKCQGVFLEPKIRDSRPWSPKVSREVPWCEKAKKMSFPVENVGNQAVSRPKKDFVLQQGSAGI